MSEQEVTYDVRTARARLGLSQTALAQHLRVSARTINRWETGRTVPHEIYKSRIQALLADVVTLGESTA